LRLSQLVKKGTLALVKSLAELLIKLTDPKEAPWKNKNFGRKGRGLPFGTGVNELRKISN